MKSVLAFMQVLTVRQCVAMSEMNAGRSNGDRTRSAPGWRLFLLLLQLLLFRPS